MRIFARHVEPDVMQGYRTRAIGGGRRPDYVQECTRCGALVLYDGEAMGRHDHWHAHHTG